MSEAAEYEALGRKLFTSGRLAEGLEYLRKAVELAPTRNGLIQFAHALTGAERHAEAVSFYKQAIELDPTFAKTYELLGDALQFVGRFDEAEVYLRRAIELDPSPTGPYYAIANGKKFTEADRAFVADLEELANDSRRSKDDLRKLNYALAKAHADLGRYRDAMSSYDRANALAFEVQLKGVPFNRRGHRKWIDDQIATFTRKFFDQHSAVGSNSEVPVFVIGMIRSGTTLTEQVLSSHPQVEAAGEVMYWTDATRIQLNRSLTSGQFSKQQLGSTVAPYLERFAQIAPGKPRVIDKMPLNYLTLGLIHLLLPNAKIVHCRRNALDTCFSIYTTPFERGAEFFYNRQSIVDAYGEYQRIMEHWRKVIPSDRLIEIDYEELVKNEESIAREMVKFIDLSWDDACLRPEDNERLILTPSRWQVRQPIYQSSVERWRRYQPWLREFDVLVSKP